MKKLTTILYGIGALAVVIPIIYVISTMFSFFPIGVIVIGFVLLAIAQHFDPEINKKSSSLPEDSLSKVTRVEVIDTEGRSYVNNKPYNKVSFSMQDDDRTLKIFIKNDGDAK